MAKVGTSKWFMEEAEPMMKPAKDMAMGAPMEKAPAFKAHEVEMCMVLAHSYVPWQCYEQAFSPREALMKGTLFPELWGVYPIPE